MGGCLTRYWDRWRPLDLSWEIRSIVTKGLRLPFLHRPPPLGTRRMKAYTLQPEEREALGRVVQEYRELGALEPHPTTQRFWQSPVFGREKKGGKKWRLVTDLKRLNVHILNPPFKMEGIKTARETINPGDWVGKIDISNAFFHLPINHAHQNYLVIEWEGEPLHFTALPFG